MYAREIEQQDEKKLTPLMKRFIFEFVSGEFSGNGAQAAIAAGYSEKAAQQQACWLLKHSGVSAAIDAALREEIGVKLTAQAVTVMRRIITDEEAPLKLRGDMAAKVVEFSGIVDRVRIEKARQTGLDGAGAVGSRRLGEMTREELEAVCRTGAGILAAAAALPPAGQTIEGANREGLTETLPAIEHNPNQINELA